MAKKKKLTPDQLFKKKVAFLLQSEVSLDAAVVSFQQKLFELLVSEYLPLFKTKGGIIIDHASNDALVAQMDTFFNRLEKVLHRDVLGTFASSLLQGANMSGQYYVAMGFKKTVVANLLKNKVRMESRLGITPTGRLKKGSYLYQLGKTDQVRQKLKNYVLNSLTGDVGYLDFQLGFRNLVIGNRRVKGIAAKGAMQKYFDQFAYDKFNELDAMANSQFATGLNLVHFIYEGSLIKTSRAFCEKRAGKAFHIDETKTWKHDPTLIDQKNRDSYRPLIDRGRYRCRHFIKYVTETVYRALGGTYKLKAA